MRRDFIILDLDGTVCDSTHREHHARAAEWEEFHALCPKDAVHEETADVIRALAERRSIIALTGRNEKWRQPTLKWLTDHDVPVDVLLMRPDFNFESDTVIKPKLLFEYLQAEHGVADQEAAKGVILVILEDRDRMVEAWRNLGFNCWQVRPGGY